MLGNWLNKMTLSSLNRLEIVKHFKIASTDLLSQRELLSRMDSKFIISPAHLPSLLADLKPHSEILLSNQRPIADYETQYWDSSDNLFLRQHLRGQKPRSKVRIRNYIDRNLSILEVKTKSNSNRTHKIRQAIIDLKTSIHNHPILHLHSPIHPTLLLPSIETLFQRISLLGSQFPERITIDFDLRFRHQKQCTPLPNFIIIELKQDRFSPRSPMMLAIRKSKAISVSLSKYCTAFALLFPDIHMPTYRAKIRHLKRKIYV
jgi:hypothetical protein